jgi:hypothetical protein
MQTTTQTEKIGIQRRAHALPEQEALTGAAVREAAAGIEEKLGHLDTRIDAAELSAAAFAVARAGIGTRRAAGARSAGEQSERESRDLPIEPCHPNGAAHVHPSPHRLLRRL